MQIADGTRLASCRRGQLASDLVDSGTTRTGAMRPADIGVIGLAVMGQSLAQNIIDHGYRVAVHDRESGIVDAFVAKHDPHITGTHSMKALVASLKRPRCVLLLIRSGNPVDACIQNLLPILEAGDIIIDAGNSHYKDTERRLAQVEARNMCYIGTGVSGGEEGVRTGPAIMPGGSVTAWPHVRDLFQSIAAKADDGATCCDWIGAGGAGHFVKMVHNGLEYGDMQVLGEVYLLMRDMLHIDNTDMSQVFGLWNKGPLNSYLVEITRNILDYRDTDGRYVIDSILDCAGQKGTGKWTAEAALEYGVPLNVITEAVFARFLSSLKDDRHRAQALYPTRAPEWSGDTVAFLSKLGEAVYSTRLLSYAQGFMLLHAASQNRGWNLDFGGIAQVWRSGCIIRSGILSHIIAAYQAQPARRTLLTASHFQQEITSGMPACQHVVAQALLHEIPVPALSSALSFYGGYRRSKGAANLIQAQRDYFGAHTYERTDRPRGEFHHTDWTGAGGDATAGSYVA